MKNIKESSHQTTESRILEAAEREFLLKGYAGARTTAIADAAGVTHAMLHYYFRTKDKLFERIISSKVGLLRDIMLESIGEPDMPLFEKIETVISNHLDFIAANKDIPRFLICEVFSQPGRLSLVVDQLRDYAPFVVASLQRQIDDYAERGMCRRVGAGMLVLDIASLNIFAFMAAPLVNRLLGGMMDDIEGFVAARKQENIETIMRKLRV